MFVGDPLYILRIPVFAVVTSLRPVTLCDIIDPAHGPANEFRDIVIMEKKVETTRWVWGVQRCRDLGLGV